MESQSFTIKDARTHKDEYGTYKLIVKNGYTIREYTNGTVHYNHPDDKDVTPIYPEPEGEPSY